MYDIYKYNTIQYNTSNMKNLISYMKAINQKKTREEKEEIELNSVKIHKIIKKKKTTFQEEEKLVWILFSVTR